MKIAISTHQGSPDSKIDTRFGRAQNFLILNEEGKLRKSISNPGFQAEKSAGQKAVNALTSEDIDVLITGNIGASAFSLLKQDDTQIYTAPAGIKAKGAFEKYQDGELDEAKEATGPPRKGRRGRHGQN